MDLLSLLKSLFNRKKNDISQYVHYKIIDEIQGTDSYILQCVNSKSIFKAHILELIHDTSLLYGLHPLQSCFIGLEYAKHVKNDRLARNNYNSMKENRKNCGGYGVYKIIYQDRKGNFSYIDIETGEEFTDNPVGIVFSDNIIKKFNPEQAFYLGICAGLQIHKKPDNVIHLQYNKNLAQVHSNN